MVRNRHLRDAKIYDNDEFYTQLVDIEKEILCHSEYIDFFKDKIVYCNCDDPLKSNFYRFFIENFHHLSLKKFICTFYDKNIISYNNILLMFSDSDLCEDNSIVYKLEWSGDYLSNGEKNLVKTPLVGNGSFNSPECLEILKCCDVVVTNPPFSLARKDFLPLLFEYDKKFLVVGNITWFTDISIFPMFVENKLWIGYNTLKSFICSDGTVKAFGNIVWLTNIKLNKNYIPLNLDKSYQVDKYFHYLNFNGIDVDSIENIPYDYYGFMGVPLNFLTCYNPDQFELVGSCNYKSGRYGRDFIGIKSIGCELITEYLNMGGKSHYTENMNVLLYRDVNGILRFPFSRIIIKRKV